MPTSSPKSLDMDASSSRSKHSNVKTKLPPPRSTSLPRISTRRQQSTTPTDPATIPQSYSHPTHFPTIDQHDRLNSRWSAEPQPTKPLSPPTNTFDNRQAIDDSDNQPLYTEIPTPDPVHDEYPKTGRHVPVKVRRLLGLQSKPVPADPPQRTQSAPKGMLSALKSMASAAFKQKQPSASYPPPQPTTKIESSTCPRPTDQPSYNGFLSEPRPQLPPIDTLQSETDVEFQLLHNVASATEYPLSRGSTGRSSPLRMDLAEEPGLPILRDLSSKSNANGQASPRGVSVMFDGLDWDIRTIPEVLSSMREEEEANQETRQVNPARRPKYSDYYHNSPHLYFPRDAAPVPLSDETLCNSAGSVSDMDDVTSRPRSGLRNTAEFYAPRRPKSTDSGDVSHSTAEVLAIPARRRIAQVPPITEAMKSIKSVRFNVSPEYERSLRSSTLSSYRTESEATYEDVTTPSSVKSTGSSGQSSVGRFLVF